MTCMACMARAIESGREFATAGSEIRGIRNSYLWTVCDNVSGPSNSSPIVLVRNIRVGNSKATKTRRWSEAVGRVTGFLSG